MQCSLPSSSPVQAPPRALLARTSIRTGTLLLALLAFPLTGLPESPQEEPPVVLAAGDIADCTPKASGQGPTDPGGALATARLIERHRGTVLALGDLVYGASTYQGFRDCYHPAWGRFRDRTRSIPGNHEYHTPEARPFYRYWGDRADPSKRGYYSFNLGAWHLVALNSEAPADRNSSQARWLRRDLADTDKRCILAFTHRPLFASGELQRSPYMRPLYRILYRQHASVVLTAHSHAYERFVPQGPHGAWEPERGLRQFVVGTGGAPLDDPSPRIRHSRTLKHRQRGVLRLELGPGHYRWRFLAADGNGFSDSGSDGCVDRGSAPR